MIHHQTFPFFELIVVFSDRGHKILSDIIHYVEDEYIGSPLSNVKPREQRQLGEERIKLFLDNKKICDSVEGKDVSFRRKKIGFSSFRENQFIKDTYYHKKYHPDENRGG